MRNEPWRAKERLAEAPYGAYNSPQFWAWNLLYAVPLRDWSLGSGH